MELVQLSKLINRRKVTDIIRFNMERIEQAVKSSRSLKAAGANLCIGENRMYALRNKECNVIANIDRIVKVAETFYRELHRSQSSEGDNREKQ